MITNLVLATMLITTGIASQYDPGVMDSTIRTRQAGLTAMDLPRTLPSVDGYVAVEDCSRIGDLVLLRPVGQVPWETFLIADCSGHARTTAWMLRNNILAEVDYETARRWGTVGRGIAVEMTEHQWRKEYLCD